MCHVGGENHCSLYIAKEKNDKEGKGKQGNLREMYWSISVATLLTLSLPTSSIGDFDTYYLDIIQRRT